MSDVMYTIDWLIEECNLLEASRRLKSEEEEAALRRVKHAKAEVRAAKKAAKVHSSSSSSSDVCDNNKRQEEAIACAEAHQVAAEAALALKEEEYLVVFNDCIVKGEELQAAAAVAGMNTQQAHIGYYKEQPVEPRAGGDDDRTTKRLRCA